MNEDRMRIMLAVHTEFVAAASLPETTRPYGAQSRLEEIQKLIMEEIKKHNLAPAPHNPDDEIPF